MNDIIEVKIEKPSDKNDAKNIYEAREMVAKNSMYAKKYKTDVSIIVLAYNRLENTKRCVESILKYTNDVNYDLMLIDNGSDENVLEYFKTIDYDKKQIIRIDRNIGSAFPFETISLSMLSKYVALVANDIIVTKNWLSNILKVFQSDKKIGLVNPVSSNVSNLQLIDFSYDTYDQMQEMAEKYNQSNPSKWQERLRIITLGMVVRKECLYAIGWPMTDVGFLHDFIDDDLAFRVRKMGYKVVLAGDTWICHDHKMGQKNPADFKKSIEQGRTDFRQKHYGIDAWDDVNNYIFYRLGDSIKKVESNNPKILGIDVKCGTPILDIKNIIRRYGIYNAECSAFTMNEKYVADLNTICDGIVACGQEETLTRKLLYDYYDYIVIDRPLNAYHEPMSILMDAFMLLRHGGQLLFSLKNTNNIYALLEFLGTIVKTTDEYYYNYTIDALCRDLASMNINVKIVGSVQISNLSTELIDVGRKVLESYCNPNSVNEMSVRMLTDRIWLSIEK